MTVELHTQAATDGEVFVIAWLAPFFTSIKGAVGIRRRSGDPLPFGIVREVTRTEDGQLLNAYPTVSVHWLGATEQECAAVSADGHRRMQVLIRDPLTDVDLGGGVIANVEWLETNLAPDWVDFKNDQIFRKVSRYDMAVPFIDA